MLILHWTTLISLLGCYDVIMRTTLTLDPDVSQKLKTTMAERAASLKEVVNDALRRGLAAGGARPKRKFRVEARSLGFRPGIDVNRLNQLVDELEMETFAARLQDGRKKR